MDSSKFDNRDRPAADIYLQLMKSQLSRCFILMT
ncbi:hypothetical protein [Microcoleus sp. Pol11C3]